MGISETREIEKTESSALRRVDCEHCHTPFKVKRAGERFCCAGCEYVYGLLQDEDLIRFYDLGGEDIQPVGSGVFSRTNWTWIKELKDQLEGEADEVVSQRFNLAGISCVGCVWLIDRVFEQYSGGVSCRIDAHRGSIELSWRSGRFDLLGFAKKIYGFGYRLRPWSAEHVSESSQLGLRIGLCGAFALNAMLYTLPGYLGMEPGFLFSRHFDWLSILFATASLLVGGGYFIKRAGKALARGVMHIDLPISVGICAAYSVSWYGLWVGERDLLYFDFVSIFSFLMLVGRWLQVFSVERNRIKALAEEFRVPQVKKKSESGGWVEISAETLAAGDEYILEVDAICPIGSCLVSRNACFSLDWISGEAEAKAFAEGACIPSGAICRGSEAVCLRAREAWDDSLLRRLTAPQNETRELDRVAQRWVGRYLGVVLATGFLAFGVWWWIAGLDRALGVLVATLVVSCPCGIGIALPLADDLIGNALRKRGVFVRSQSIWNRLLSIQKVVFDKTGTLTRPRLQFRNSEVFDGLDEQEISILSNLVSLSTHPVSATIREWLLARRLFSPKESRTVFEEIGEGVQLQKNGNDWRLGKASWVVGDKEGEGTVFAKGNIEIARFYFSEEMRSDARDEALRLKDSGLELYVLSGDETDRVRKIAFDIGIEEENTYGELSPSDKADWIAKNGDGTVLMVGDGANDSLAFDVAQASASPATENALLLSKADFYFLGEGISGVRSMIEASGGRRKAIGRTLAFAIGYNVLAGACAIGGLITPLLAAIVMPLSSIVSLGIVWKTAWR